MHIIVEQKLIFKWLHKTLYSPIYTTALWRHVISTFLYIIGRQINYSIFLENNIYIIIHTFDTNFKV